MNRGYIRLWRKVEDSAVFQNEGLLKVFLYCLMRANYEETFVKIKTGRGFSEVKLLPGSFIFGRESAAKKLHMPPSTLWKRILKLEKLDFLNIESDSHYSIIYIINWHTYQAVKETGNSEGDRQGTGKEHREELKTSKNKKTFSSDSVEIRLSELLFEKILSRNPKHKKPNLQTWAKSVDLMRRVDGRTPEDIRTVILWCQGHHFWQNNILSTGKLRENFDQLQMKMGAEETKKGVDAVLRPSTHDGFTCPRCSKWIVVKADLTPAGCIYCEMADHKQVEVRV